MSGQRDSGADMQSDDQLVTVGRIAGVYGVKGWIRVESFTEPVSNVLSYCPWIIAGDDAGREVRLTAGRPHGAGLVAHLEGVDTPEDARRLIGREIRARRQAFPDAGTGEFYWTDLVGLKVVNLDGTALGNLAQMLATGANDVMVLRGDRRRLIPFLWGNVVKNVDLASGIIQVDWDPDF